VQIIAPLAPPWTPAFAWVDPRASTHRQWSNPYHPGALGGRHGRRAGGMFRSPGAGPVHHAL
jgi:hypothetical protein